MTMPSREDLRRPWLQIASDGKSLANDDVIEALANLFALTPLERSRFLASGKEREFNNRCRWARWDLEAAKLLENLGDRRTRITDRGKEALRSGPSTITSRYLSQFPEYLEKAGPRKRR